MNLNVRSLNCWHHIQLAVHVFTMQGRAIKIFSTGILVPSYNPPSGEQKHPVHIESLRQKKFLTILFAFGRGLE